MSSIHEYAQNNRNSAQHWNPPQLTFARTALQVEVLQSGLRKQAIDIFKDSSARNFDKAVHLTKRYYHEIKREQETPKKL